MYRPQNYGMRLLCAGVLLGWGCAYGVDAERPEEGTVDDDGLNADLAVSSVEQQLDQWWTTGPFVADQNDDIPMELDSTHVCILTKVSGRFAGGGEAVQVLRVNGRWRLRTQSLQHGVGGEAFCFRKSGFLANGSDRGVSRQFANFAFAPDGCESESVSTWLGDATTYVSGITGPWNGGCEFVKIHQAASGTAPSQLETGTGQDDEIIGGFAQSFFAGTPGAGVRAKFFNSQTFAIGSNQSIVMAATDLAMCHFTEIRGDFNGGGEWVQIRPVLDGGIEKWQLISRAVGGGGVNATARCFLRDQR